MRAAMVVQVILCRLARIRPGLSGRRAHASRSMHHAEESSILVESSDSPRGRFVKEIPNIEAASRARTRTVTTLDARA